MVLYNSILGCTRIETCGSVIYVLSILLKSEILNNILISMLDKDHFNVASVKQALYKSVI